MHLISIIVGLVIGFVVWFAASHWLASVILTTEKRYPQMAGARRLLASEAVACALLFLGCVALAFWIASLF